MEKKITLKMQEMLLLDLLEVAEDGYGKDVLLAILANIQANIKAEDAFNQKGRH